MGEKKNYYGAVTIILLSLFLVTLMLAWGSRESKDSKGKESCEYFYEKVLEAEKKVDTSCNSDSDCVLIPGTTCDWCVTKGYNMGLKQYSAALEELRQREEEAYVARESCNIPKTFCIDAESIKCVCKNKKCESGYKD